MWHRPVLPALRPHKRLLLRTVVLGRKKANNRMHVLVSEKTAAHLPVADTNPVRSVHSTLKRFLTEIFGAEIPQHKVTFSLLKCNVHCFYVQKWYLL
jgi:8-oxo-dGDP phosphatase